MQIRPIVYGRRAAAPRLDGRPNNLASTPATAGASLATPIARRAHLLAAVALAVCLALLCAAPAALAHAQLLRTSPASGATLANQPQRVAFSFGENVGGTLGAVRVYDAAGNEVDDANVAHPHGDARAIGVGLKAHLPDGTYTATYRVISADTHIVYGGLVFNIGHASSSSKVTVAGLIKRNESGEATKLAFGAVRALDYVSIALLLGALAFVAIAWLPALRALVQAEPSASQAASRAFARRIELLLCAAVLLGFAVSVLGILLQGASASGASLWASLKGDVIGDTLGTRFGAVWAARAGDWLVLGALLLGTRALRRSLSATVNTDSGEVRTRPRASRAMLAAIALGSAYIAITPALAGHASIEHPTWLFFPSDVLHVLAASVWVGGIACLLLALPAATRELPGAARALLAARTRGRSHDRDHGRHPGADRRAYSSQPARDDVRRARARQDRAAARADRTRLGQPRADAAGA
jgi:copper transport protein